jgi:agmatine deiminase
MQNSRIKIGLIQTAVSGDLEVNLRHTVDLVLEAVSRGARIICLQELFRAPYFPQAEHVDADPYAEDIPGESTRVLAELARDNRVVIIVPIYERKSSGEYYNAAVVIDADGKIHPPYRKIHIPFDPLYYEKNYFRQGTHYRVFETAYGKIAVLICYDQWFPEAARAVTLLGARIIFYPTAIGWIKGMEDPLEGDWKDAWETVQRGHAISNGVHVAAVNRVGTEGDLSFWGGSFIADAFGNIVARAGGDECVLVREIDLEMNEKVRAGWGFLRNRRPDTYAILVEPAGGHEYGIQQTAPLETPRKSGFFMPAEWERHESVWLAWPHDNQTFPELQDVESIYCEIIKAFSNKEKVNLLVCDDEMKAYAVARLMEEGVDPDLIRIRIMEYADVWFRDYGPTFVVNRRERSVAMVNWRFNAWGEKYPELMMDDSIPFTVNTYLDIPVFSPGIVMEGGSIDVNGKGTILTTEQCLLNPNRNPGLSREDIEWYLNEYLGVSHIIWLKSGIAGDDTDGHVDDIARFVDDRTVICVLEEDPSDENYAVLQENYRILKESCDQDGNPFRVIPVPMPGRVGDDQRFPASYMNFYIGNGLVLVPVFGHANDHIALMVLEDLFPGREVVGIDCTAMVAGMGAIHCISQQQPSV